MSTLIYKTRDSKIGFAVNKVKIPDSVIELDSIKTGPHLISFTAFSNLVSRDRRIPPREETKKGFEVDAEISDYENAKIWNPDQGYKNSIGCALVPRMLFDKGFIKDIYAYAFQGLDSNKQIYFAGLLGYIDEQETSMTIISAGLDKSDSQLESVLNEFSKSTSCKVIEFLDNEKNSFDKDYKKVIKLMDEYEFIDNALFIFAPLILTEIGGFRLGYANSVEIK